MAIPRQTFTIYKEDKPIGLFNEYFLPSISEKQALKRYCKFGGCEDYEECSGERCNLRAKEVLNG